mgnify:CR=1 FL=1
MVRNRINGSVMTFFREDGDEYNIRVRYAPEFRQSIEDIENIILYGSQGQSIRVKDVAQVVEGMTPPKIERKDRERVGFNSNKFDVPVLVEEFLRVGVSIDLKNRKFVDVHPPLP